MLSRPPGPEQQQNSADVLMRPAENVQIAQSGLALQSVPSASDGPALTKQTTKQSHAAAVTSACTEPVACAAASEVRSASARPELQHVLSRVRRGNGRRPAAQPTHLASQLLAPEKEVLRVVSSRDQPSNDRNAAGTLAEPSLCTHPGQVSVPHASAQREKPQKAQAAGRKAQTGLTASQNPAQPSANGVTKKTRYDCQKLKLLPGDEYLLSEIHTKKRTSPPGMDSVTDKLAATAQVLQGLSRLDQDRSAQGDQQCNSSTFPLPLLPLLQLSRLVANILQVSGSADIVF